MPTQVIFDMTEPATKAMIDSWEDSTPYTVTMTLTTGTGENRHVASATEITEEGSTAVETPEEVTAYAPKPPK